MRSTVLAMLWFGLEPFGLTVAGPAFLIAYILHFALINILAHTLQGFRWQSLSLWLLALHVTLALALLALARNAPQAAAIASVCLALATGLFGLRIVLIKMGSEGRVAARLTSMYRRMGWRIHETK